MTTYFRAKASFIIESQNLTPDEISIYLGLKCDKGFIKGNEIITPNGKKTGKFYNHTAWIINSKLDNILEIDEHLISLLDTIELSVYKVQNLPGVSSSFHCSLSFETKSGVSLNYEIISRISALGSSLDIDLYDIKS